MIFRLVLHKILTIINYTILTDDQFLNFLSLFVLFIHTFKLEKFFVMNGFGWLCVCRPCKRTWRGRRSTLWTTTCWSPTARVTWPSGPDARTASSRGPTSSSQWVSGVVSVLDGFLFKFGCERVNSIWTLSNQMFDTLIYYLFHN